MHLIQKIGPIVFFLPLLLLAACQTASLEDIAPVAATQPVLANAEDDTQDQAVVSDAKPVVVSTPSKSNVVRANPGVMSVVPLEKTAPAKPADFVVTGARRTGQYPTFGKPLKAATSQLTTAEKLEAEAEMTELLKARAATPGARAQYQARLRELRALARNHAKQVQQEIEN